MSGCVLDQKLTVTFPDNFFESSQVLVVNPDPDIGVVDLDSCQEEKREDLKTQFQPICIVSILKPRQFIKKKINDIFL